MGVDNCEEGGAGVHRGQCTRTRGGRAKVSPVASTSQTPAPRGKVLLETQMGECTCCRLQPPHQTPTSGLSYCQLASGQQFLQTGPHFAENLYLNILFTCMYIFFANPSFLTLHNVDKFALFCNLDSKPKCAQILINGSIF